MSRFYAKFSEADDEIITFSTAKERDAWVNFQDEISVATRQTKENAAFQRVPLTTKEATYIIKSKALILCHDKESDGTVRDIYVPRSVAYGLYNHETKNKKGTKNMEINTSNTAEPVKINRKISMLPSYGMRERKALARSTMQNAFRIGNKQLAYIDVGLFCIPPYQRDKVNHVFKIAMNWDDRKCDVIRVSYDDKKYLFNVVDGQHRAAAAKMRGIPYLVCEIETGMNTSAEARMFVEANEGRKKLSPFDEFKANQFISEEDDTELSKLDKRIAKVCDDYNIEVKKSQACGTLKSVKQARDIIRKDGEPCLEFIFDVIQDSHWDKLKDGYCYIVVAALQKVYNEHKDSLDLVRRKLVPVLINNCPRSIESIGNGKYPTLGRIARWDAVLSDIIG